MIGSCLSDQILADENEVHIHPQTRYVDDLDPCKCVYCHRMFGKKLRKRSPENVMAEIKALHDDHGVSELEIIDDCFNLDLPRRGTLRFYASPSRIWSILRDYPDKAELPRLAGVLLKRLALKT